MNETYKFHLGEIVRVESGNRYVVMCRYPSHRLRLDRPGYLVQRVMPDGKTAGPLRSLPQSSLIRIYDN